MTAETLLRANELTHFITNTEFALGEIEHWLNDPRAGNSLSVSQYSDGSGHSAELACHPGNKALLEAIKAVVVHQLEGFKKELESL